MNFFRRNFIRSTLTYWRSNVLILADLILCALVLYIMLQNAYFLYASYKEYFADTTYANNYSYTVVGNDFFSDIVNQTEMLDVAEQVRREIHSSPLWFDVSSNRSSVERSDLLSSPDLPSSFFLENKGISYDTVNSGVPVIIVSTQVFEAYNLEFTEGVGFPERIDWENEDQTPIVLGYDFMDYFDLGDQIKTTSDTGIVTGFLAKDSLLMNIDGTYTLLDEAMLTPCYFPKLPKMTVEKRHAQEFSNMYTGTILLKDSNTDLQEEINQISAKYGFYPISVSPIDGSAYTNALTMTEKNVTLLIFLTIISSVLSITALCNILYKRTMRDQKTICIYLLSGVSLWKIRFSIALEIFLYAALSVLPAIAVSYVTFQTLTVSPFYLLGFILIIVIISLLPVFLVTGKTNIDTFMQGESE